MCGVSSITSGLGLFGTIAGQAGDRSDGRYQRRIQRRTALINLRQAEQESAQAGEEHTRQIGQAQADNAGSGLTLEGSPTDRLIDLARERSLAMRQPLFQARLENARASAEARASSARKLRSGLDVAGDAFSFLSTF